MSSKIHIYQSSSPFESGSITISRPVVVQGGTYFTKIRSANNTPYYVQFDSCKTKQGVVFTNKRSYVDLLYSNEDVDIIEWFENMQENVISRIFDQRNEWFQSEMERIDIENNFVNISKSYKGGKYHLIRVGMNTPGDARNKGKSCVVFDEYENVISAEDIQESDCIEGILEVQGVRFTSKSFQIDMMCKQMKICQQESTFDKCMIKHEDNSSKAQETRSRRQVTNNMGRNEIDLNDESSKTSASTIEVSNTHLKGETSQSSSHMKEEVEEHISKSDDDIVEDAIQESEGTKEFSKNEKSLLQGQSEDDLERTDTEIHNNTEQALRDLESSESGEEVKTEPNFGESRNHEGIVDVPEDDSIDKMGGILDPGRTAEEDAESLMENVGNGSGGGASNNSQQIEINREDIDIGLMEVSSAIEATLSKEGSTKSLKDPQDIYYEIYKIAKQKAREHKVKSITHYLEAKNIKNQYLLDDLEDESDPEDDINDYYYDSDVTNQSTQSFENTEKEEEASDPI